MTDRTPTIDIYSDVVCPWCFIGKRRLERALDQLKGAAPANITWRPFQLNPTMPEEGMDRTTYLETKFGSLDTFRQLEERVLEAGAAERIQFAFERMPWTPNTFLAHRLIWYAGQQGRQDALVESLFRGYFEEGADIGAIPALVELGGRVGLDAESFLRSDEGVSQVKEEEAAGHRLGIRAVPYFVMNGTLALSGAQPPDRFAAAFKKVEADQLARKAGT
jgi:predicted DsbA family dithiol-disulfide isomerase